MSRPLTLAMAKALKGGAPRAIFAAVDHPSGIGRFWTGLGSKDWDGPTWTGSGLLGGVSPVKATSEIAIQEITFWMSGVDLDIVNRLNGDIHNLTGDVWLACLDNQDRVIADPYKLLNSVLDYQTFKLDDQGTATVFITARTGFVWLERSLDTAWTDQNQQLAYPGDTGNSLIDGLQNKDILFTW